MRKLARNILLYSNLAFALLLVLAYSATFINPSKIVFPSFLGLFYPLFLFINFIYLVYWTVRFRKAAFISLIAILLGWSHLMGFFPVNGKPAPEDYREKEHRIMSYNVRTFDQWSWCEEANCREQIFDLIDEQAPDILCFQEFFTSSRAGQRESDIQVRLEQLPYSSVFYTVESNQGKGVGLATFSRYPVIKTSRIPFDNSVNQAVYSDILIHQDTIRVINVHLQSVKFGQENYSFLDTLSLKYSNRQLEGALNIGVRLRDAFAMRAEQARIIDRYIEASPYPVIVAGDFNDTPVSYAYRRVSGDLQDAFKSRGRGIGNTYAGDLPLLRIDHLLFDDAFRIKSFSRVKKKFSDHYPIVTDFGFPMITAEE